MEDKESGERVGLGELIVMLPITVFRGIAILILMPIVKVLEWFNRWEI